MMWDLVAVTICALFTVAITCATFVYGRQIGYDQRNVELVNTEKKTLEEQNHALEAYVQQLEFQIDAETKRKALEQVKTGWEMFEGRRNA